MTSGFSFDGSRGPGGKVGRRMPGNMVEEEFLGNKAHNTLVIYTLSINTVEYGGISCLEKVC